MRRALLFFSIVPALLSGCAQQTKAPVVSAKLPTMAAAGLWMSLDGSASSDPNAPPLPLVFTWSLTDHPTASKAAINAPDSAKAGFQPDVPGSYTVRLLVSNGLRAASADTTFTVSQCGVSPPVVSAITPSLTMPAVGSPVRLTATVTDADNDPACAALGVPTQTATYAWSFQGAPVGSHAQLSEPDGKTPSFTPDVAGDYVLQLIATDSTGIASAPFTTTITAAGCGPQIGTPTLVPDAPLVGSPTSLSVAITTTCPSSDPQSSSYSFTWSVGQKPADSHLLLVHATDATVELTPDVTGSYSIHVVVADGAGRSTAGDVPFSVNGFACGFNAPVVSSVTPSLATPAIGSPVQLTATVTDADNAAPCAANQDVTYVWSFRGVPNGSRAQLSDPTGKDPTFTPDMAGDYVLRLVVTDSTGLVSAPLDTTVTAASCGPQVGAATLVPAMPLVGGLATVSVAVTTTCPSSDPLSSSYAFAWSVGQKPAASQLTLAPAGNPTLQLTPDVTGSYSIHVVVTDGEGRSAAGDVPFDVTGFACGFNAPVANGLSGSLVPGVVGSPTQFSATVADADNLAPCSAGQTFSYYWRLTNTPAGSQAALNDPKLQQPSLIPDVAGTYAVQLVVTDSAGVSSAPASFSLIVGTCAPSAMGPLTLSPSFAAVGAAASLSVTTTTSCPSTDPNSNIFHYAWTVQSAPAGSRLQLTGATLSTVQFTPDVQGSYTIGVMFTDGAGRSGTASLPFTVSSNACGFNPPRIAGVTASANPAAHVPVTVTASATDPDNGNGCSLGQVLTYHWALESQPAGSTASLSGSQSPDISFVPDLAGQYTVGVTVQDSTGLTANSSVTFTAAACSAPVARIGMNQPIVVPASTTVGPITLFRDNTLWLDASQSSPSSCLSSGSLQYQWSVVSLPPGGPGNGGLNSTSVVNPSAGPLNTTGQYIYQLVVSDAAGTSAPATLTVNIQGSAPGISVGSGNISISMAVDPLSGNPAWAYYDQTQSAVSVSFCTANCSSTNPTVRVEQVQSGLGTMGASQYEPRGVGLAYTSTGVAEVAYFVPNQCTFGFASRQPGTSSTWKIKSAVIASPGTNCGTDGLSGSNNSLGRDLALAIRSDGLPGIAFLNHSRTTGFDSLSFIECTDGATLCQTSTPSFSTAVTAEGSTQLSGYEPSLKYTSGNHPRVATYNLQQTQLFYSACDSGCTSGAWPGSDTVAADPNNFGSDVGRLPSLALDSSDNPRIAYTDSGNNQLLYASCSGSCLSQFAWSQQVVDGNQGDYASLVLDASNTPYIAYTDQPNQGGALRLAVRQSGSWSSFTIDNTRSFFYTGLSVSAGPEIHIAYGNGSPGNRGSQNLYTAFGL